ncbi:hypothetical protein DFA_02394 [Cavenderia fasciculata]|uniref:FNIP repeat-containing protein n=1 Tax=Cavenderia fasciculata TaxID=261658 RepID=F4PZB8_CACFS|nr:uncharacterized protein DFA_02394 [Cavenderia fasciculata]EGG19147.1 hypothetical protein DFA_02394 [Cavenderia fasciculata]|eukprot:XP_004366780.1 hypothetical protein DFA_02394 [Cavenderia fasciculata]
MSIYKLSNLLLSQIITDIEDNGDIICLLVTCKHLFNNSSLKRSIQFKGIGTRLIDTDKRDISIRFIATVNQFNINSFRDILKNSMSYQHVIVPDKLDQSTCYKHYPDWVLDCISAENRVDKSNITTAVVNDYDTPALKFIDEIPSIETVIINQTYSDTVVDLGSINRLPNLRHLSICADEFIPLGQHTSLKSLILDIGTSTYSLGELEFTKFESLSKLVIDTHFISDVEAGLLPISLTSLTLKIGEIPPQNMFTSLTSLVDLYLSIKTGQVQRPCTIDLSNLLNLKTLELDDTSISEYLMEVRVPLSLKSIVIWTAFIQIPLECPMPFLERLYIPLSLLVDGKVSLLSSQSIKKLIICHCYDIIPTNIIPPSLEKLTIYKHSEEDIIGQVVFPPTLTHLTILGTYDSESAQPSPESLIKLKQKTNQSFTSLPRHLKKLVLATDMNDSNFKFPSSYPPHLETLNLLDIEGDFMIDIPSSIKDLSIPINPIKFLNDISIYSISSRIKSTDDSSHQQLWLPYNTIHLTCLLLNTKRNKVDFRLDEVINHTNVRYLSLSLFSETFQFSIQRLDPDKNNVLVLERHTLQGGIITQRKTINQQQQYDPIYLHLHINSSSPFALNWSFENQRKLIKFLV